LASHGFSVSFQFVVISILVRIKSRGLLRCVKYGHDLCVLGAMILRPCTLEKFPIEELSFSGGVPPGLRLLKPWEPTKPHCERGSEAVKAAPQVAYFRPRPSGTSFQEIPAAPGAPNFSKRKAGQGNIPFDSQPPSSSARGRPGWHDFFTILCAKTSFSGASLVLARFRPRDLPASRKPKFHFQPQSSLFGPFGTRFRHQNLCHPQIHLHKKVRPKSDCAASFLEPAGGKRRGNRLFPRGRRPQPASSLGGFTESPQAGASVSHRRGGFYPSPQPVLLRFIVGRLHEASAGASALIVGGFTEPNHMSRGPPLGRWWLRNRADCQSPMEELPEPTFCRALLAARRLNNALCCFWSSRFLHTLYSGPSPARGKQRRGALQISFRPSIRPMRVCSKMACFRPRPQISPCPQSCPPEPFPAAPPAKMG